jgi:hypothetical protein
MGVYALAVGFTAGQVVQLAGLSALLMARKNDQGQPASR